MADVNLRVLRHLKEELAWAIIDKWFQVTNNKMLFETVILIRN